MRSVVTLGAAVSLVGLLPVGAGASDASDAVVDENDLPAGYEFDVGSPLTFTGTTARFVTIDDCALEDETEFGGPKPRRHYGQFQNSQTHGEGTETVYEFPATSDADWYFDVSKPYFARAPKCNRVSTTSGAKTVPYGTFHKVDVGKVGDQRAAMSFDSARSTIHSYIAIVQSGHDVAVVVVRGGETSSKAFTKLVQAAGRRLADATAP